MNAIQLLTDDHKSVTKLFRHYESLEMGCPKTEAEVARKILSELEIHARIEEEIFYPAFQRVMSEAKDESLTSMIVEFFKDHHEVKDEIRRLRGIDSTAKEFCLNTLIADVEAHVFEEENRMFPIAEKLLALAIDNLGKQMNTRKRKLIRQAEYLEAHPGLAHTHAHEGYSETRLRKPLEQASG